MRGGKLADLDAPPRLGRALNTRGWYEVGRPPGHRTADALDRLLLQDIFLPPQGAWMSACGAKADLEGCCEERPLMTHSGQVMSPDAFGNYTVCCIV